jgi:hypothetical protein
MTKTNVSQSIGRTHEGFSSQFGSLLSSGQLVARLREERTISAQQVSGPKISGLLKRMRALVQPYMRSHINGREDQQMLAKKLIRWQNSANKLHSDKGDWYVHEVLIDLAILLMSSTQQSVADHDIMLGWLRLHGGHVVAQLNALEAEHIVPLDKALDINWKLKTAPLSAINLPVPVHYLDSWAHAKKGTNQCTWEYFSQQFPEHFLEQYTTKFMALVMRSVSSKQRLFGDLVPGGYSLVSIQQVCGYADPQLLYRLTTLERFVIHAASSLTVTVYDCCGLYFVSAADIPRLASHSTFCLAAKALQYW